MKIHWIAYRDITDFPRKVFQLLTVNPETDDIIKAGVFPGQFGYPDMHIKWHSRDFTDFTIKLVTYSEQPLTDDEVGHIFYQASKFAEYSMMSTKELSSHWKGFFEGESDPQLAENAIIDRINRQGKDQQEGPAKVLYLHKGKLKWAMLHPWDTCKEKCIAYDVGIYD